MNLVSETQLEVLKQNAAMCNFRPVEITVHECMIVGQYLENISKLPDVGKMLTLGKIGLLTEAMHRDGFKRGSKQARRMIAAAESYYSIMDKKG